MRAVIDTNIFMAGLLNVEGGAAKIVNYFRSGTFDLVISRDVFDEYLRVIHLFDNAIPSDKSEDLLEMVFEKSVKVKTGRPPGLCKDPDDEKFLAAALAGNADYLVTKNKKDFPRGISQVSIVNVREFLSAVEEKSRDSR